MLIGLTGYKGSGKSTVANYLEKEYGFKRLNFKDALVSELKERFPDLLRELSQAYHMDIDKLFENKPAAMRALMQNYGTEVRRKDDPNYWAIQYYDKLVASKDNIVTDDVRFLNEFQEVKLFGGVLIRVTRPDITSGGSHTSETEQESFVVDFTIEGVPGSHESIYKQVDSIIQDLKRD